MKGAKFRGADPAARRLANLRAKRTRATNTVLWQINHLLTEPATWGISGRPAVDVPDELPSWWRFWSDVLKGSVVDAVRWARMVERAEGGTRGLD